jgi:hypothetical protein
MLEHFSKLLMNSDPEKFLLSGTFTNPDQSPYFVANRKLTWQVIGKGNYQRAFGTSSCIGGH